jgi:hypothetical protein
VHNSDNPLNSIAVPKKIEYILAGETTVRERAVYTATDIRNPATFAKIVARDLIDENTGLRFKGFKGVYYENPETGKVNFILWRGLRDDPHHINLIADILKKEGFGLNSDLVYRSDRIKNVMGFEGQYFPGSTEVTITMTSSISDYQRAMQIPIKRAFADDVFAKIRSIYPKVKIADLEVRQNVDRPFNFVD